MGENPPEWSVMAVRHTGADNILNGKDGFIIWEEIPIIIRNRNNSN